MNLSSVSIRSFGERAIEICWPQQINEDILNDIKKTSLALANTIGHLIEDIIPSYANLLLVYAEPIDFIKEQEKVIQIIKATEADMSSPLYRWIVPVCYDTDFGLDLADFSESTDLSQKEVIRLHSQGDYTIHFFGFLPGFFYLGGLDKRLHCPRKAFPRPQVLKGSVGIAGSQTGIYPQDSPGGWQIIGRTPIELFRVELRPPVFAKIGDKVRFLPIDKKEFYKIEANGSNYRIKKEVIK